MFPLVNGETGYDMIVIGLIVAVAVLIAGGIVGAVAGAWGPVVVAMVAAAAAGVLGSRLRRSGQPRISLPRVALAQVVLWSAVATGLLVAFLGTPGVAVRVLGLLLAAVALALNGMILDSAVRHRRITN
jgi:hypothetical protein